MKKNKLLVVLLVIVCVLSVSVGFAVVSQDLLINGTATTGDEDALSKNYNVIFVQYHTVSDASLKYKYLLTEGNVKETKTSSSEAGAKVSYKMITKGDSVNLGMDLENLSTEYGSKLSYSILVGDAITYSNLTKETMEVQIDEFFKVYIYFSSLNLAVCNGSSSQTNNITEVSLKVEMIKTPTSDIAEKSILLDIHTEAVEIK